MLRTQVRKCMRRFSSEEDGSIAIETVLIVPVLFAAFMSMFAIFDAYRQHSLNQKAGYTLGDMISRETNPIDQSYMIGAQKLLQFLTLSDLSDTTLRVSSVKYDLDENKYKKEWSKVVGSGKGELTDNAVAALADRLPMMKDNEYIMVVETWVEYDPPFETGLTRHDVVNFVFTRPRYAPQVLWSDD
jgi:Flp pilus assembly protein TadG